ncbi:MAG: glycosyltransferase [Bryobacteraceae bacterium]
MEAATGDWVAIVDADCIPGPSWLRVLRADLAANPEAAAVSSRTMYAGRSWLERISGLLSRSYLDPGRRGSTRFISGNAACFRREVYLRHPLPEGLGAFASRIQSEAFLREGETFLFDPELLVIHDFEGWAMERDIRRNHGFCTVITRLRDARLPYAGLIRLGPVAIPFIVAGKTIDSVRDCLRCFGQYGVKLWELPLALAMVVVTHMMEAPGMLAAYRGRVLARTAYR